MDLRPLSPLLLGAALGAAACSHAAPAPIDPPSTGSEQAAAPPVASEVPAELPPAPAEAPIEAPPSPPEGAALIVRAAGSDEAFVQAIDPGRGLVIVRYEEAGPDARHDRGRRSQRHHCGAAIARSAREGRAILSDALEQADPEEWECSEAECTVPGMEWTPTIHVRFARDAAGELVLGGLLVVSEAALGDDWLEAARAYVDRALGAAARGCPSSRR